MTDHHLSLVIFWMEIESLVIKYMWAVIGLFVLWTFYTIILLLLMKS